MTFSYRFRGLYPDLKREYDQALTSAIEKGIRFRDQEATKWLLINEFNGKENMRGWFQPGKSFDLPNPYTAQVKWYNPCIEHKKCLIADDQNRNNCAQLHGNKCQKEYRVAVLTPLKQEPVCSTCGHSKDDIKGRFCSNSFHLGEPGNEAKKDEDDFYKVKEIHYLWKLSKKLLNGYGWTVKIGTGFTLITITRLQIGGLLLRLRSRNSPS